MIIAQKYLIKDLMSQFKFEAGDIVFRSEELKYIINRIDREDGVRNLKRALESIISNLNLNILLSSESHTIPIMITEKIVDKYVKNGGDDKSKVMSMYL